MSMHTCLLLAGLLADLIYSLSWCFCAYRLTIGATYHRSSSTLQTQTTESCLCRGCVMLKAEYVKPRGMLIIACWLSHCHSCKGHTSSGPSPWTFLVKTSLK